MTEVLGSLLLYLMYAGLLLMNAAGNLGSPVIAPGHIAGETGTGLVA